MSIFQLLKKVVIEKRYFRLVGSMFVRKHTEKLTLVDAASQFSKLSAENQELREKMKSFKLFLY